MIPKGSTVEMVLDRMIELKTADLDFSSVMPRPIVHGVVPATAK